MSERQGIMYDYTCTGCGEEFQFNPREQQATWAEQFCSEACARRAGAIR